MLRHIISVSLAMTACATLIPTNAKAATTIVIGPDGKEIITTTGDPPVSEEPSPSPSFPPGDYPPSTPTPNGPRLPDTPGVDPPRVLVPEPLTIFGTATALGWGVFLKRKSFKKKKS
jgi:hypothetical protein